MQSFTYAFHLPAGNIVVIALRLVGERLRVHALLVSNLAVSDALMGVYMICLAAVDLYYQGSYIENSLEWRSSGLCQFMGVIATISSEVRCILNETISLRRKMNPALHISKIYLRNELHCIHHHLYHRANRITLLWQ